MLNVEIATSAFVEIQVLAQPDIPLLSFFVKELRGINYY
jgi:hypothetical protein